MKDLPIGIQTLSSIIEDDKVYVDKTEIAYKLVSRGRGRYFLSRPRRFGKSLFLDTLRQIFEGNRELFKGLYIYDKWEWNRKFPVNKLDLTAVSGKSIEELNYDLSMKLSDSARELGIEQEGNKAKDYLRSLIINTTEQYEKPVVILIDEYNKPLLDNLEDVENGQ